MTNVFLNNQQHEVKIKRFMCVEQIKSSFFRNSLNQVSIHAKRENRP